MKFIISAVLLVAIQVVSSAKYFGPLYGRRVLFRGGNNGDNIANINGIANSNANALAVNAGVFGDANANAFSAATNVNNVSQRQN